MGPVGDETALLWGLLRDALWAPLWLLGLLAGRARLRDGARPLLRLYRFAAAARMTALLAVLNVLVFGVEMAAQKAGMSEATLLRYFALRPPDLGDLQTLVNLQSLSAGRLLPLPLHVFAHASLGHLLGNLLGLLVFGRVVERHLGGRRLLGAYALAAVTSTALSLLAQLYSGHAVPTLGASGAVAGLVALGVLLEPMSITFEALLPLPLFAIGWLTIAADFLALGRAAPSSTGEAGEVIDHPAHVGGYLSVLLFYYALSPAQRRKAHWGLLINLGTALLCALLWWRWRR